MDLEGAIRALHDDLAAWLGSEAPDSVFDRFAAAQDVSFSMVTTTGQILRRDELLAGLRAARNAQPGLRITISEIEVLSADDAVTVVRFLESHDHAGVVSRRRVLAVLRPERDSVRWWTLQETDVPG
ncbi:DUF4440 domain-containing protein [Nocardia sp. NPDC050378]|uniref:DUF4440 domain-containing protein n=1 Tax=Nocardia sp. NPDC050378 TaxID=3155400 RepID=UPI0033DF2095